MACLVAVWCKRCGYELDVSGEVCQMCGAENEEEKISSHVCTVAVVSFGGSFHG